MIEMGQWVAIVGILMPVVIAGDIGGTSTRLRLVDSSSEGSRQQILFENSYSSPQYEGLAPIVQQFLSELGSDRHRPTRACFAIAGPVVDQTARLTNLPWTLVADQLQQDLHLEQVRLINDFSAIGYGILELPPEDLHTLQAGDKQGQAPIAVLGAGTGLGEAYLVWQGDRYRVCASEGGHTDFPARSELEFELLMYLYRKHGRISVERVVSGQGIRAIYQFLRDSGKGSADTPLGRTVKAWEDGDTTIDPSAEISQAALQNQDSLAVEAMRIFVEAYGAEAGNLALKILPYGGVYVAGGIATKIVPLLEQGGFLAAFLNKGRLSSVLKSLSVQVVKNPQVGLVGAAAYAASL